MYDRHGRFLPLSSIVTAVLVILMMLSTMQIQRVHSLAVAQMRQPSTRRRIAFASAVNCPYTTCSRAAGAAPRAWVSHQSSSSTDRRRRRRQNQGDDSTSNALFASSSSSASFSSAATGTDSHNKSGIRLVLDTADDTEEFGALLCTLLLSEEEDNSINDSTASSLASRTSTHAAAGSVIFLQGDLGAGKTCLARGFVRAAVQDWDERVTSPTYLLSNVYQTGQKPNNLE
jgi:hypothetical protein